MKTPLPYPSPLREQDLLKLFSAGSGPHVPECLRYLAGPSYHMRGDGKWITLAGDGRVFLWAAGRVPGFADYRQPPHGMGYLDLPTILALRLGAPLIDAPDPRGAWGARQSDDVDLIQQPAMISRWTLARLHALDTRRLGIGSPWLAAGRSIGWRYVSLTATFGRLRIAGVIFCEPPPAIRLIKKAAAIRRPKPLTK